MAAAPGSTFAGPWFTVVMVNAMSWRSAVLHVPATCITYASMRASGRFGLPWDAVAIFDGRLDNFWGDEIELPELPYAIRRRGRA